MKINLPKPIVYIMDDDESVCRSIHFLVESVNLAVRTYTNVNDFQQDISHASHGCILLDIRMPSMSGLDLQKILIEKEITLPIIIITAHADIPIAIRAMKQGAFDFLSKPFNHQLLLEAIQKAIKYDEHCYQRRMQRLQTSRLIQRLTKREFEVLEQIRLNQSNRAIADKLCLSEKTVERHRSNLMRKLEVSTPIEFIRLTDSYFSTYK